eukprot:TRINITY_DN34362_c0_g1_i1.p1 TRINITY_DN34362_c0_g1~~TRINITY_DN34362_c0_g1_i1.p1  ORF type:complete len:504 (+),score=50.17 TRINITY_DN34362_c0_g1_i1:51-1562(+)
MAAETLQVTVVSVAGRTLLEEVDWSPAAPLRDLQIRLAEVVGVPPSRQHLVRQCGEQLRATAITDRGAVWSLADAGVKDGDFLTLVVVAIRTLLTITTSTDNTAKLWDAETGCCEQTFLGHGASVDSAVFSPHGDLVLTASDDYTMRLWNVEDGSCTNILRGHSDEVNSAVFSSDGSWILSASRDRTARLWQADTGTFTKIIGSHPGYLNAAVFVPPADAWVLTACDDCLVRVFDVASGVCLRAIHAHRDNVLATAWSFDGTSFLTGGGDCVCNLWDANTFELSQTFEGHVESVFAVAFAPDGATFVSGSGDGTARLWNARPFPVTSNNGLLRLRRRGRHCMRSLRGDGSSVYGVAFSADSSVVLAAFEDGVVRCWLTTTGECFRSLNAHTGAVLSVAMLPAFDSAQTIPPLPATATLIPPDDHNRAGRASMGARVSAAFAAASARGNAYLKGIGQLLVLLWNGLNSRWVSERLQSLLSPRPKQSFETFSSVLATRRQGEAGT